MAASGGTPVCWNFDSITVDTATFRVTVDGVPQPLEPKSFRLLQFLIEHRDRVVSKEEIFQAVWAGTFVSDNALTRAIAQIRKAIGDDPKQSRYIETIPTVGYRFVAAVTESAAEQTEPLSAGSKSVAASAASVQRRIVIAILALVLVGLAVWLWRSQSNVPPPRVKSFLPVQFSSSPGLDMGASFSRDGSRVAYASDKTGSFEIFVKSFDSAARELQLTNDGSQNLSPAFSPDGRWVAYTSARRRGIYRVAAIGGPVQRLTDFGVQPVWSPDSRTIVFRSSGSASLSTTDYYWPAESSLWIVPAGGGEPKPLTESAPIGGQSFPSFSADGAEIRFLNQSKGVASLYAYRIADGNSRKLFESNTWPYSNATFAPDDTRMWFVSWQLNGDIGIWELPLDPATLTPTGDATPLYRSAFAAPRDLALSADGKRLAFTAVQSTSAVMVQPVTGGQAVAITGETTYRYGIVRSSPDGTRVMYSRFPRNGLARSWIWSADGAPPVAMGSADVGHYYPGLSPDNSEAFFVEQRERDGLHMVRQRLADGAVRTLSALPRGAAQAAWSRDGSRILFHSMDDDRRHVYVQDTVSGVQRIIASGPEDIGFPRFSRDEKWISLEVTHRPRGGDDIAVMPADGGPFQVILKSDESSFAAGWMPDNDRILFAGFRDGAWNVYTVSRTTGKTERLTGYTSLRTYVRYPDWLIGDRIVFEFNETKGNILVANLSK